MVSDPAPLTPEYIASRWPCLFHMAEAGSWESIRSHGLLSTSALLDLFEVQGADRVRIESSKRSESVEITHPKHGSAWIRDNKPINETVLRRTLVGMSEGDWYRTLNSRVFFWLTEERLNRLRNAPPYKSRAHDILTIDTGALLERYAAQVELAHLNTGAVHPSAKYPRGRGTFQTIPRYLWPERVRAARAEPIVELTIPYAVPDIADFTIGIATH